MTKYELPGFSFPKPGMSWATKCLLAVGGLILVQGAVGVFAIRRLDARAGSQPVQAAGQASSVGVPPGTSHPAAMAPVAVVPPAPAVTNPAPQTGPSAPAPAAATVAAAVVPSPDVLAAQGSPHHHHHQSRASRHGASRDSQLAQARAKSSRSPSASGAAHKKSDAIDDLLKSFK